MERPDLPFNQILEREIEEWKKFRWALRKDDQQFLDALFEKARLHVEAGVNSSRPWPFETILISILLEHEKALAELKSKIKAQEEPHRGTNESDLKNPKTTSYLFNNLDTVNSGNSR